MSINGFNDDVLVFCEILSELTDEQKKCLLFLLKIMNNKQSHIDVQDLKDKQSCIR